jgi:hypothetical protein
MSHICWIDELTHGYRYVTTAESWFMLCITEGSGITVIEELG